MLSAPFLNAHHLNPIPTFFQEWVAAVLGLLAATLLLQRQIAARLAIPAIGLLPLGLLALLLVQFVFGKINFPTQALLFALYLLWAFLLLILGHTLRQTLGLHRLVTYLAYALLIGAILALALSALHPPSNLLGLGPVVLNKAGLRGNLGQPNHLADYLWLALVSAVYLHLRGKLGRLSYTLIACTLLSGACLTHSRSVVLYAVGFVLLSGWAAWRWPHPLLHKTRRAALFLLAGTVLLLLLFEHFIFGASLSTSVSSERFANALTTSSVRLQLWRTGLALFLQHPWLGIGVGQFSWEAYVLNGMRADGTFIGQAEHAHNLFIHLLAEFGIAAPLLVLGLFAHWAIGFMRTPWSPEHVWIGALLMILGTHSQLEYPLWYTFFLSIAALALGMGSTTQFYLRVGRSSRSLIAAILFCATLTLIQLFKDYRVLEQAINEQRLYTQKNETLWHETLADLQRLHRESLFSHYVDLAYARMLPVDRNALTDKIVVCQRALRVAPVDVVALKLAYLLALDQRPTEAQEVLHQLLSATPTIRQEAISGFQTLHTRYAETDAAPSLAQALEALQAD